MAISHVQGNSTENTSGTAFASLSVSLGATVGVGNFIAGAVFWGSGTTTNLASVTDDKSNSYTIVDRVGNAGDVAAHASFYLPNITNGPITFTENLSPSTIVPAIAVDEYSGVATSSPIDGHTIQFQAAPGATADAIKSGNITTTVNGDLIYGSASNFSGTAFPIYSAGTGFAIRQNQGSGTTSALCITEDQIQSSLGTAQATFTQSIGTQDSACAVMAFMAFVGNTNLMPQVIM